MSRKRGLTEDTSFPTKKIVIIGDAGAGKSTFKEILKRLLKHINKKRILLPFPLFVAEITARLFEIMPKPILTRDQLILLKYDNVPSGKYKTNSDIGVPGVRYFDEEVNKYSYMWKEGGQYSTDKYILKNDSEKKLN